MRSNNLLKAKKLLKEICQTSPHDGVAWHLLSDVYGREENFEEVKTCCNHALAANEKNEHIFSNLGHAHAALGNINEAIEYFNDALKLNRHAPVILNNLATVLQMADRANEAVAKFKQAIAIQPGYAKAHYGLAGVLASQGQFNQAIDHFQTAIKYDPQLLNAYLNFGDLLAGRGFLEKAESLYKQAFKIHPNSEQLYYRLAKTLQYQGRFTEALAANERGLRLKPDNPDGFASAAEIYERQGDSAKAFELIKLLKAQGELNATAIDVYLRVCRKFDKCYEAIDLGNTLLADSSLDHSVKSRLHHSLGTLFDKLGEFEPAFDHFLQANECGRLAYDAVGETRRVDDLTAAFSHETLAGIPSASIQTDRPIFIVGMPRSGTTLVEQIIAAHPEVFGAGELAYINEMVRPLPPSLYPAGITELKQNNLDGMAKTYLNRLSQLNRDAKHITDKMPGNFRNLGLISLMLPKAKIIHCKRNPLDTCLSIFFQNFNLAHTYATKIEDIGNYYKEYQRLMAHWQEVLDIPIFEISYADLVNDQENQSRKMIEFCGLDWHGQCLNFHQSGRKVATASYDQVSKPVYRSSLERWKNYEKHLGPLREILGKNKLRTT